jgi:hypothetical protein
VNKNALDAPTAELRHAEFRKSSYSGQSGHCIEVAPTTDGGRWLRDSKDRTQPPHYFTASEWNAFIRGVKNGEFD